MGIFRVLLFGNAKKRQIFDGTKNKKKQVIDLRPREFVFRITWKNVPGFLKRHAVLVATIILFIGASVFVVRPFFTKASVAVFYPHSCLGGWEGAKNAEDTPQISDNKNTDLFNSSNSATLNDRISQMYCGDFKGTLPDDSEPTKITLHLSWTAGKTKAIVATSTEPVAQDLNEDFSSSKNNALNPTLNPDIVNIDNSTTTSSSTETAEPLPAVPAPTENPPAETTAPEPAVEPTPTNQATPEVAPTQESTSAPVSEPAPTPAVESVPVSNPAPASDSAPTSFLDLFAKKVFAADITEAVSDITSTTATSSSAAVAMTFGGEKPAELAVFSVLYTLDGVNWKNLGTVSQSEIGSKDFEIPVDNIVDQADLSNIQINIQSSMTLDQDMTVYLDGMALNVEYASIATPAPVASTTPEMINLNGKAKNFRADETPKFKIDLNNLPLPAPTSTQNATTTSFNFVKELVSFFMPKEASAQTSGGNANKISGIDVIGPNGQKSDLPVDVVLQNGVATIAVQNPKGYFRPGKYLLHILVDTANGPTLLEQSFMWGVLAINTDRSFYNLNTNANIQMAALDDYGHTICNAPLELDITSPSGVTKTFSVERSDIQKSGDCGVDNVTNLPDYSLSYFVGEVGNYYMTLRNNSTGFSVNSSFVVQKTVRFDVERVGATRINPFKSDYAMTLNVTPARSFKGKVVEYLPSTFDVISTAGGGVVDTVGKDGKVYKQVSWDADLQKDQPISLSYVYRAPKKSPELYSLGTAELISYASSTNSTTLFVEQHPWQLASDAACTSVATGNWIASTTWSCAATPGVGDTVVIAATHTVTVTVDAMAASVTLTETGNTTANALNINTGITLKVGSTGTGTVTFTAPTGNKTSTLAVGAGILTCGTVAIGGGASAASILSISTGTVNLTGNMTFSGTAANAQFTFSGLGRLNITGDIGNGGAITGSTGTIRLNGSSNQNLGIYTTYPDMILDNGSTVRTTGTTTIARSLTVATTTTLIVPAYGFTVTGSSFIVGTTTFSGSNASSSMTFTGDVFIATSTGVWNNSVSNATLAGNLLQNGTFTAGTGTTTFSGTAKTLSGTAGITLYRVSATSLTNFASTTVTNNLGGTLFTNGLNADLHIATNTVSVTTLTAIAPGNEVFYDSGGAQTCKVTTYVNLIFDRPGTKTCAIVSTSAAQYVYLLGSAAWTVSAASVISGNLYVGTSSILTIPGLATTVASTTTVVGTTTINSTTGAKAFKGDVNINVGGTWNETAAAAVTFGADLNNSGLFTASTGVHTFSGAAGNINSDTPITIPAVSVSTQLTNNATTTISTSLAGAGKLINGPGETLNINFTGAMTLTSLDASSAGNVVSYGFAGAQTIKDTSAFGHYANLVLTSSGLKTGSATTTIDNGDTLTISGTATAAFRSLNILPGGTYTNSVNTAVSISSDLVVNGTFTPGTGIITMSGTNAVITSSSTPVTIPSLTITGAVRNQTTTNVTLALAGAGNLINDTGETLNIATSTVSITTLSATSTDNTVAYTLAGNQICKVTQYINLVLDTGATKTCAITAAQNVSLLGTSTWITTSAPVISGNLYVGTSTTLTAAAFALTVATTTTVDGTFTISSATGAKTFGNIYVNSGGTWNNTAANEAITITGDLDVDGTFNAGSGVHTFTGPSDTISGAVTVTIPSLTVNGYIINNGTLTLSTALAGSGTLVNGPGDTININFAGPPSVSNFVASSTGNTVIYGLSGNQTVDTVVDGDYYNLQLTGSGLKTFLSTTTIDSGETLTIGGTATAAFTSLSILAGGTYTNSANSSTSLSSDLVVNGTYNPGTATTTMYGTNALITSSSTNVTLPILNITSPGQVVNVGSTTITTGLTGTGAFTNGAGSNLFLTGPSTPITTLNATATDNTVTFSYVGTQATKATSYQNLIFDGGLKSTIITSTIHNLTLQNNASYSHVAGIFTVSGNLTIATSSTFTKSSTANFTVASTTWIGGVLQFNTNTSGTKTFGDIYIDVGGSWINNVNSTYNVSGDLTNNGTFTSTNGGYAFSGTPSNIYSANPITLAGVSSSGTLINNATTTVLGNVTGSGKIINLNDLSLKSLAITVSLLDASSTGNTVHYTGASLASNQTVVSTSTYYNLDIDNSANSNTANLATTTTVLGDLTIQPGAIFNASTSPLLLQGNWSNSGTFAPGNSYAVFNGSGNQNIVGTTTWNGLYAYASNARTLYFSSGQTQTILPNGVLSFAGAPSNLLTLAPLTASTTWKLNVSTTGVTESVLYTTPSFSDASGITNFNQTISVTDANSIDGGNNSNWSFNAVLVSCNATPSSSSFGTLSNSVVNTASVVSSTTMTCGGAAGCTLFVQDDGDGGGSPGLYAAAATSTPLIASATATLSAGTEGYGIQAATSTAGSGATLILSTIYDKVGNDVGGLTTTATAIASSTAAVTDREVLVTHKAAISGTTLPGSYSDTITYSCVGN